MGQLRAILFLLCCLAVANGSYAAGTSIPSDNVELRSFDAERIAAYRLESDLQYERELHTGPSPWERFKQWLARWLDSTLGETLTALLSRNVVLLLCIVLLIIALVVLGKGGIRRVLYGASARQATVVADAEDIRELDLPSMIAEAERKGDLRRAIRLHYLLVLRKLVDRGILRWSPDLTDRDYVEQITDAGLKRRFSRIAGVFQWVWYGESPMSPERYEVLRLSFIEFEQGATP